MLWEDEIAISVVSRTMRMKLLNHLDINYQRDPLVEVLTVKRHLTKWQAENICNKQRRNVRAKTFIDILSKRMTVGLFVDFLDALGDYRICGKTELRMELLRAYTNEGGDLTLEMKQWMNIESETSECVDATDLEVEETIIETRSRKFPCDTVDFGGSCCHENVVSDMHHFGLEFQISYFGEDRISKGKPMIIATSDNDNVTDISNGLVHSKIILYDLIDKKIVQKNSLVGHSDSILFCFTVEDGTYCLISNKDSQESDAAGVQITLWPSQTYAELDLEDVKCERIEKLSACVINSEERVVLLIFSQDSYKIQVYFISNDQIEDGGSVEVTIEKITGVKCINIFSKHYCVFWGGQELEFFEVNIDTGLDPKPTAQVAGQISCCEFIPCDDALQLAVCYSDRSHECTHSIDLWRVEDQRTRRVHKTSLQMLKMHHDTQMNMLFADQTSQLIVSADRQYTLIAYNPDEKTLIEDKCVDVEVTDSHNCLSQHKLLKSDDEFTIYFVRRDDSNVVSITSIALGQSISNNVTECF